MWKKKYACLVAFNCITKFEERRRKEKKGK